MDGTVLLSSQIFGLIHSFPLLDDVVVIAYGTSFYDGDGSDGLSTVVRRRPLSLPRFTGSLNLFCGQGWTLLCLDCCHDRAVSVSENSL